MTTTLKSILETETRPEVIFGHIHRRHDEINSILGCGRERERPYENLQEGDIVDLYVIRSFFDSLTSCFDSREADARLRSAAKTFGIEVHVLTSHMYLGITLSHNVMCPSDEAFDAYQTINPRLEPIAA